MLMELKYLQTFLAIVETGSFSRAAIQLNYTRSTITYQMQQLEAELQIPLFEQMGRNLVLTRGGEELVPKVREILHEVQTLQQIGKAEYALQGTLRVAMGETILCYLMPPVLRNLCQQAPMARLFLQSMNCYDIRDELLRGNLDLGVFYGEVGGLAPGLVTSTFYKTKLVLVASPQLRERYPDFMIAGQRMHIPLISNEPLCIFRQMFEEYLREKEIQLDHTIMLNSIPTIINLVKSGVGISYLPLFAVKKELACGELVTIPTGLDGKEITAVIGYHKNKRMEPLLSLLLRLLDEEKEKIAQSQQN